jgi:type IV secretory pathway TrbF-like protein
VVAIASGIYTVLAWVVPGRAAAIAGRGVSLALHGGALVAGGGAVLAAAASPLRGVLLAPAAIRGVSALLGLWVLTLSVMVWQFLDARRVQAFVQTVQVDDKGKVVQLGMPQDLLAYTPPDGVWIDMLSEWVRRMRWRGTDATLTRAQWVWVYRHTCGQARRLLQTMEEKEHPFKPGKKLVAVELRSVTKTPVPESYQVLWAETSTEPSSPSVKTTLWTGTFSVGRIQLPTLADAMDNRLGLCVTAYDLSPQP